MPFKSKEQEKEYQRKYYIRNTLPRRWEEQYEEDEIMERLIYLNRYFLNDEKKNEQGVDQKKNKKEEKKEEEED